MSNQSLHERVIQAFAIALVGRDFDGARRLLASDLAARYSADKLEFELGQIIAYSDSPPTGSSYTTGDASLPSVTESDSGWAYASIDGDGYVEAVSGIVTKQGLIRELEWGRP